MIKKHILPLIIIFLLSLPGIWSLLSSGFFQTDDADWMIIRFSAFHQALSDGQFPVRFLGRLNHEYGYPVTNFVYPGFMYLGEVIKILGFGFIDVIKITLGITLIESGIFTYLWLSKFFGKASAYMGALVYMYFPYHLFDMYTRGSVGEVLGLAIVPFILWQMERRSIFFSSIGIAGLVLAHNTLAFLFMPLLFAYGIVDIYAGKKKRDLFGMYFWTFILGIGMASFFWIPAIFDLHHTIFSKVTIAKFDEYFAPLPLIGTGTIVIFLLIPVLFFVKKIRIVKHRLTLLLYIFGVASIILASSLGSPIWYILPASFIQFPFRLLSITILSTAFLSAFIVDQFRDKKQIGVVVILTVLFIFSAVPYIKPKVFIERIDAYYATNEATTTVANEYMPSWVKKIPDQRPPSPVEVLKGEANIQNVVKNSRIIRFDVQVFKNTELQINTLYFPGWFAWVNGKEYRLQTYNPHGAMIMKLSPGNNEVILEWKETPLRLLADGLSLFAFLVLISISILPFLLAQKILKRYNIKT